jgi:hypothetical protein
LAALGVDTDGPATLIVAWRSGKKAVGRTIKAGGDVIESLREYAKTTISKINDNEGALYDPNDEQDEDHPYLETDRGELLDTTLLKEVEKGASLEQTSPEELRTKSIALYGLVLGKDPSRPTILIRRGSPIQLAKKSLVAVFDDTLTKVSKPMFAFDSHYDLLLTSERVYIISQKNFEGLFKESEAVLAKTSEWVNDLSESLPIAEDSKQWLNTRLRANSVMRRRVQNLLRSGYLADLTPDVLATKMRERGFDPDDLLSDGKLVINKDTEHDVLQLLNEDLWTGDFSGEQYAASRKSRRS